MKFEKLSLLILSSLLLNTATSCQMKETLLLLNWGEYISDEVVENFEEEYNCNVSVSIADSNELFYSKIKSGTTAYDLVVPSEYMVMKMVDKDLLQALDFSLLSNYSTDIFLDGVNGILDYLDNVNETKYSNYCVPYFFGTFGLMYNKKASGVEEKVKEYGWDAYFSNKILSDDYRIGMYNVPRDAYAATMFYNHLSPNEFNDELLSLARDTLNLRHFDVWGTDTLKKSIQSDNLDLAFVYTGDYLDMVYASCSTLEEYNSLSYDIYIPDETIAFMDNLVMPKNARHKDLAYKFIDYMLTCDAAYKNASVVGYCTPLKASYNKIIEGKTSDDDFLKLWAKCNETYYPLPKEEDKKKYKGTPLTYFDNQQLVELTNLIDNAKVN